MSKLTKVKPPISNEKLYNLQKKPTGVHIGITYLDRKKYGLKDLFAVAKGNRQCLDDFYQFLDSAREKNDIGEFITEFVSHNRANNQDALSKNKVKALQQDYQLEVDHLIHLHCKRGGKGKFVVHGFQIGDIFEIVWLDSEHNVH